VAPRIGETELVRKEINDRNDQEFRSLADINILLLINVLAALSGFALFALRRAEREYLWFGLSEALTAIHFGLRDYEFYYSHSLQTFELLREWAGLLSALFFLAFIFALLKGRRNWLYWSAIASISVQLLVSVPENLGWGSLAAWSGMMGLLSLPYYASILALLYRGARRGVPDARLLLGPVALSYAEGTVVVVAYTIASFGRQDWLDYLSWLMPSFEWPFPFYAQDVTDLLMQLSILAVLLMRFARTRRDEQRLGAELESARAVQQVLIPSELPAIPGFAIGSVYKPATQVGGDFFQIIPTPSNGAIVVIGDVSGKGMPAAMTVSLLVGTLRTLAHYTHSPGEILSAMNQRMLARSNGGFTTCLVLRVDLDGKITAANAGHPAPYNNGAEQAIESGLPLGISAQSKYPESTFSLSAGGQLTLVTDGVVEARGKDGELFGFARTQAISRENAEQIAQTTQEFGQDDDITVLTLRHTGPQASASGN